MTPELILSLLQIGTQLAQAISSIQQSNPEAWAQVEANYSIAVAAWKTATAPSS